MTDLDLIDERIAKLRAELAELETAARVLRKLKAMSPNRTESVCLPRHRKISHARLTITDAAKTILSQLNGDSEHYTKIAQRAFEMGYKGKSTSTPDKQAKAFWATMKRQPEIFQPDGNGRFKLKQPTD